MARALRSALDQQGVEVEVIVVDDGSTDGTEAFLAKVGDSRVHVVRHEQARGVAASRNAAIDHATAAWVAFLDDDDIWAPRKLVSQLRAIEETPGATWACTGVVLLDRELHMMGPQEPPMDCDVADALLARNVVPGGASGVLASTELVREVGRFDPSLSSLADWDLWIRLALRSRLASVRQPLVGYLLDPAGMAHDVTIARAELTAIADKYAVLRARRGISIDHAFWLWYFGHLHLRAGRRLAAARAHATLAWSHRQPRGWPLVAVALGWPRIQGLRARRRARRMPPSWHREVDGWLGPIRRGEVGGSGPMGPPTCPDPPSPGSFGRVGAG